MEKKMTRAQSTQQKKEHIYQVALQLFEQYGYDNVTTKMISKESGVSEGSIFNFFKEKAAILSLLSDQLQKELYPMIEPTKENLANPSKTLEAYLSAQAERYMAINDDILKVYLFQVEKAAPSRTSVSDEYYDIARTIEPDLTNFLDAACAQGKIKCKISINEFAYILISLGSGILHTWLAHGNGFYAAQASQRIFHDTIEQFLE